MGKKRKFTAGIFKRFFVRPQTLKAQRWDSARFNPADKGAWDNVDSLSFNAAASPQTRATSRHRARYLVANNAYAAGAANAITTAVCGVTPRLQLTSIDGSIDRETLGRIESDYVQWSETINLPTKLRAMRYARFTDGEAFACFYNNPALNLQSKVQLDIYCFDCDRVRAPVYGVPDNELAYDGIYLDKYGTPVKYRVLNYNPGDLKIPAAYDDATFFPAREICHWFKKLYPEQLRGFSELAPAIELFNLIDRYSKAVVQASETAADLAMVFTTDAVDDPGGYNIDEDPEKLRSNDDIFAQIPWARGMTITAPAGWDAKQVNAEQPSSTYSMLVNEILSQIGSAIGVPKLLMKNSAENYNYSSARVDLQQFQNFITLDRTSLVHDVLSRIWATWWKEYSLVNGMVNEPRVQWYFGGFFHVDPLKEANAQVVRVTSNLSSLADEYGARGRDWEQELTQIAREKSFIKQLEEEYGISLTDETTNKTINEKEDDEDASFLRV